MVGKAYEVLFYNILFFTEATVIFTQISLNTMPLQDEEETKKLIEINEIVSNNNNVAKRKSFDTCWE